MHLVAMIDAIHHASQSYSGSGTYVLVEYSVGVCDVLVYMHRQLISVLADTSLRLSSSLAWPETELASRNVEEDHAQVNLSQVAPSIYVCSASFEYWYHHSTLLPHRSKLEASPVHILKTMDKRCLRLSSVHRLRHVRTMILCLTPCLRNCRSSP